MGFDMSLEDWQKKSQCRLCKGIIFSRYSGEFVSCKCGAISVDQTPYYGRYIGNPEDFIGQISIQKQSS